MQNEYATQQQIKELVAEIKELAKKVEQKTEYIPVLIEKVERLADIMDKIDDQLGEVAKHTTSICILTNDLANMKKCFSDLKEDVEILEEADTKNKEEHSRIRGIIAASFTLLSALWTIIEHFWK